MHLSKDSFYFKLGKLVNLTSLVKSIKAVSFCLKVFLANFGRKRNVKTVNALLKIIFLRKNFFCTIRITYIFTIVLWVKPHDFGQPCCKLSPAYALLSSIQCKNVGSETWLMWMIKVQSKNWKKRRWGVPSFFANQITDINSKLLLHSALFL